MPNDYPTIQAGVDAAALGDTVLVAPGVYTDYETRNSDGGLPETACVFLKDGVLVKSELGRDVTTIDTIDLSGMQPNSIIAKFLSSEMTAIDGFTVEGRGQAFGAFVVDCENVAIRNCLFQNFDGGPTSGGGALTEGNVTFSGCTFMNCRANVGGAIRGADGIIQLVNCEIQGCTNVGVYLDQAASDFTIVKVSGCRFISNTSTGGAAGLVVSRVDGQTIIYDCWFEGNISSGSSAGGLGLGSGPKTVEHCVFVGNGVMGSSGQGGALSALGTDDPLLIRNNTFVENYKIQNGTPGASVRIRRHAIFENNIITGSQGGAAIDDQGASDFACNVYWDNPDGVGVPVSPTDRIVDPEFCDPVDHDLTLQGTSPCRADDPLGCGLIGALGVGCNAVSVPEYEVRSWGKIKGMYR